MVNGVNGSGAMQQMQQLHQMRQGQGLGQLMQSLPQDFRSNLQQTLESLDETQRKDIVSQLKELDVANLSQDELMNQIQNILNPSSTSAYDFSTYA